jgi:hypothetical protein
VVKENEMDECKVSRITNELATLNTRFSNILGWHSRGNALNVGELESIGMEQHKLIKEMLDVLEGDGIKTGWKMHECSQHDDAHEAEREKFWARHAITMAEEEEKMVKLENERRKQELERDKYTS